MLSTIRRGRIKHRFAKPTICKALLRFVYRSSLYIITYRIQNILLADLVETKQAAAFKVMRLTVEKCNQKQRDLNCNVSRCHCLVFLPDMQKASNSNTIFHTGSSDFLHRFSHSRKIGSEMDAQITSFCIICNAFFTKHQSTRRWKTRVLQSIVK